MNRLPSLIFESLACRSLYIFAALFPLLMTTAFYDVFEKIKWLALFLYLALALLAWPWLRPRRVAAAANFWTRLQDRLDFPLGCYGAYLLFLACFLTASLAGTDQITALLGTHKRYFSLAYFVACGGLMLWMGRLLTDIQKAGRFVLVLTLSMVPLCLYGVLQYVGLDPIGWQDSFGRAFASLGSPLHLSLYAAMLLPLTLAQIWGCSSLRRQLGWLTLLALCLASTFLAYSRGPWLALGLGILIVFYFSAGAPQKWVWPDLILAVLMYLGWLLLWVFKVAAWDSRALWPVIALTCLSLFFTALATQNYRMVLLRILMLLTVLFFVQSPTGLMAAFGGLLCGALLALALPGKRVSMACVSIVLFMLPLAITMISEWRYPAVQLQAQVADKIENLNIGRALEKENRIEMWKSVIPWFKDHPCLGTGPQSTREVFTLYRTADYIHREGQFIPPNHLHNDYLNLLVTGGAVSLAAWILFLLFVGGVALQHSVRQPQVSGLLGGMAVFVMAMGVGIPNISTQTLFFMLCGVACLKVWGDENRRPQNVERRTQNEGRGVLTWVWAAGALCVALPIVVWVGRQTLAELYLKQGIVLHSTGHARESRYYLNQAVSFAGHDAFIWSYLAEVYRDLHQQNHTREDYQNALMAYERAAQLRPLGSDYVIRRAEMLALYPETRVESLAWFEKAHRMDPLHPAILLNWANTLFDMNRINAARQMYRQVVQLADPVSTERAYFNLSMTYLREGRPHEALEILGSLRKPGDEALFYMALTYKQLGDRAQAKAMLRRLTEQYPVYFMGQYELGITMLEEQELGLAITALKQAVSIDPRHFAAQYNLGVAYWKSRQYEQAKPHFRAARDIAPNNPALQTLERQMRF